MRTFSMIALGAAALTFALPAAARDAALDANAPAKRNCVVQPNHIPAGKIVLPPVVRCDGDAKAVTLAKATPVRHPGPRHAIIAGAVH